MVGLGYFEPRTENRTKSSRIIYFLVVCFGAIASVLVFKRGEPYTDQKIYILIYSNDATIQITEKRWRTPIIYLPCYLHAIIKQRPVTFSMDICSMISPPLLQKLKPSSQSKA